MKLPPSQVCICIPAYNAEGTLAATLDSILAQTYQHIKVVVVDNASTDDTYKIASGYAEKDARVSVSRNPENIGGEGNFTRCIELASGDYTAIFHSDDIYSPEMVTRQVEYLDNNPGSGAVFAMAVNIDSAGKEGRIHRLPAELRAGAPGPYDFELMFKSMLRNGNFLFCPSAMVRTSVYRDDVKVWDIGLYATSSDADVWLRILKKHTVGVIDAPLLKYRVGQASFSYHASRLRTAPHDMLKVFREYLDGYASDIAGDPERRDFRLLELKDTVNRGFNLLVSGCRSESSSLLHSLFVFQVVRDVFSRPDLLKILCYGYFVYVLSLIPLSSGLRASLARARYGK